jgi:putative Ca2+/H+ antiporter (TMEM165/GDT1 family)
MPWGRNIQALLVSLGVVALAEIGDKTQILAILLAVRFRAPYAIVLGIVAATVTNHMLAAALGNFAGDLLSPDVLRWVLVLSFLAMAIWTLLPDRLEEEPKAYDRFGPFGATLVSFFLVEMGDKTQVATVALAARFHTVFLVAAGTTLGMLIADIPAVFFGEMAARAVPAKWMRLIAAAIFAALAFLAILDWGRRFVFA